MVALIVLNIILIICIIFLVVYLFNNRNNKNDKNTGVCVNCDKDDETDVDIFKQNKKIKDDRVFVGRFVTEEEYQQISKNRRSDISVLMEEVYREYEHLKELNK
jgi:hypothetical protein